MGTKNTVRLDALSIADVDRVGGKNASLGELIGNLTGAGVKVPNGFATTTDAFRTFLEANKLTSVINDVMSEIDVANPIRLEEGARKIREHILAASLQQELVDDIVREYRRMRTDDKDALVAVRSSATAEDLPDASFAGQQETYLNICGEQNLLDAILRVFASLFTSRAISYRAHHKFDSARLALSVGVQKMIRSDSAASGVMFTLDTETGFDKVIFITASYGLGENIVQGNVNPDEFYLFKPFVDSVQQPIVRRTLGTKETKMIFTGEMQAGKSIKTVNTDPYERNAFCISDEDARLLAKYAMLIERHYQQPMDIEWAKDGADGELYIVQARPETIQSYRSAYRMTRYRIHDNNLSRIAEGRAIGQKIGVGRAKMIDSPQQMDLVEKGDVLVTDMTDPDWEPIMKRASAIVTRRGGRTCHAAIIAREIGIPAVVGCGDSIEAISDGAPISVSCAEGETGYIYAGTLEYQQEDISLENTGQLPVKLQINVANPDIAFSLAKIPASGIGLARLEFIIAGKIRFHPRCAFEYQQLPEAVQKELRALIAGYDSAEECYVQKLAEGIATLAAAFHPHPVIVRMSDFKSNEYAGLVGGSIFEPREENPMIGFRGASRYVSSVFRECFQMECEALRRARERMGFDNIWVMIPFVRTVAEAASVCQLLEDNGLVRGENNLKVIMMCEIPSNALLAEEFLAYFDGFSIGSNDLTQLTLALDRDSALVSGLFDERDAAVKSLIAKAIAAARAQSKYVGICGQGPSDFPEFAQWLVQQGIGAMSLNPDSFFETYSLLQTLPPQP